MAGSSPNDDDKPFERITPITPNAAQPRRETADAPEDTRTKAWYVPVAFAVLMLALVFVVFWLPDRLSAPGTPAQTGPEQLPGAETQADEPAASAESTADGSLNAEGSSPGAEGSSPGADGSPNADGSPDTEAILQRRQEADSLGQRAHAQKEALMKRGLDQWGENQAEALTQQLAQAESRFDNREFEAASQGYQRALEQTEQLRDRAEQLLSENLSRGQEALQAGDDETALEAFELALTLDPDNEQARQGRRRAANLEEVMSRVNKAQAAEARGELEQAKSHFQAALELDKQNDKAREGLARIEQALLERAFSQTMSEGMLALQRQEYESAQSAFRKALKLKANAPEARDGLEQARLGLQQERIEALRGQALSAEQNERWAQARELYAKILDIDASLAFAQQGQARTDRRAQLDARLQGHIDQPSRLSSRSVREAARGALAQAQAIEAPGSKLQEQMTQLSRLLAEASTPVSVTLYSDGETQVIVYPVSQIGELGQFDTKSLKLTPGQYTAIGRRPGYREVRVPFRVTPEGVTEPPVIKTEEPI